MRYFDPIKRKAARSASLGVFALTFCAITIWLYPNTGDTASLMHYQSGNRSSDGLRIWIEMLLGNRVVVRIDPDEPNPLARVDE